MGEEGSVKTAAVLFVLVLASVCVCMSPSDVSANSSLGWAEVDPFVVKETPLNAPPDTNCFSYEQRMYITELRSEKDICVYGDERMMIGNFYDDTSVYRGAVRFPYSSDVHLLEGVCVAATCRYSPDTDILVTQYYPNRYGMSVVAYANASKRIVQKRSSSGVISYVFDTSRPDYVVKNTAGEDMLSPSFNISQNGYWLVIELRERGIVVVDMRTFEARQITFGGYGYGYGRDPFEHLAIADDGASVLVTGVNAGLSLVDVTVSCGQLLVGNGSLLSTTTPCPTKDLVAIGFFSDFTYGQLPRFYGTGEQVAVTIVTLHHGVRRVVIAKDPARVTHKLRLLSLGDSYSSGEGELDANYYLPGTDEVKPKCHVSRRAYGSLFASYLAVGISQAKNVACSGARIRDIVGTSNAYFGQNYQLKGESQSKDTEQRLAIDSFKPGIVRQVMFVEEYSPEFITIGIGGNDAGLMDKLRACAMPGTCEWAKRDMLSATATEIKRLFSLMVSLLRQLQAVAGEARIFVVGYPDIIDPEGQCDMITGLLFDHDERVFIENGIRYLNRVLSAAAHNVGVSFIDTEDAFRGKNLCSGSGVEAMNGFRLGDDIPIIKALPVFKIIGSETFHPTAVGHVLVANALVSQSQTPLVQSYDPGSIEPSDYWRSEGSVQSEKYSTTFIYDSSSSKAVSIQLVDGTFLPNSAVKVSIHSNTIELAEFVSDSNGGVIGDVLLPDSVESGYHTLHINGLNREAKPIDLYEVISIGDIGNSNPVAVTWDSPHQPMGNSVFSEGSTLGAVLAVTAKNLETLKIFSSQQSFKKNIVDFVTVGSIGLACLILAAFGVLKLSRRWVKPDS